MRYVELELRGVHQHVIALDESLPVCVRDKQLCDDCELKLIETVRGIRAALEKLINGLRREAGLDPAKALYWNFGDSESWRARMAPGRDLDWLGRLPPEVAEVLVAQAAPGGACDKFRAMPPYADAAHHGSTTYTEQSVVLEGMPGVFGLVTRLDENGGRVDSRLVVGATPFLGFPVDGGRFGDFTIEGTDRSAFGTVFDATCAVGRLYGDVLRALRRPVPDLVLDMDMAGGYV